MHCFVPLSPTSFLERAGRAFPKRDALILDDCSISFEMLLKRTRQFAQVLAGLGIIYGDKVALISENSFQSIEANFAVPATGGVIVSLNPWLPSKELTAQLAFCEAKVLIISGEFYKTHTDIFTCQTGPGRALFNKLKHVVVFGEIDDAHEHGFKVYNYEALLKDANDNIPLDRAVKSELDPIAINFTSGTTGLPKGVMFSHRAAYLHALGQVLMLDIKVSSRYLWTLPMYHVNGWGHIWTNIAVGATQIIIPRNNTPDLKDIKKFGVTHLAGAPRLVRYLIEESNAENILKNCTVITGGSAPTSTLISRFEEIGARLIHQYGLNETCGPYVVCEEQDDWEELPRQTRIEKKIRQGVAAIHAGTGLRVVDSSMCDVPMDGMSLGEIIMSGNTVALGYFNNQEATQKAFVDGWFHSGDMAVVHSDGYIEIKDRIKDLIYTETEYGWENISSIEVENVIGKYKEIKDVAVVGLPANDKTKESAVLIAFLEKSSNSSINVEELRKYCARELAEYKRPHYFFFTEIPKTVTGKVRKDLLVLDASARIGSLSQIEGKLHVQN